MTNYIPTADICAAYRRQVVRIISFCLNHIKSILPKNGEEKVFTKKIQNTNIPYSNCILRKKDSCIKKTEPARTLPYIGMEKPYNLSTPMVSTPKTKLRNNKPSRSAMSWNALSICFVKLFPLFPIRRPCDCKQCCKRNSPRDASPAKHPCRGLY